MQASGSTTAEKPHVYGGPTKRFFVSMLTRDIELSDAILDLVDNCVDGAMRQRRDHLNEETPYQGYKAELTISKGRFEIVDNCGGIPKEYIEDAFSLGRPNLQKDGDLPTIGMYGIGMKRAIFKIGSEASVTSRSADGAFEVDYSRDWLDPDNKEWDLPITELEKEDAELGVKISVPAVRAEIGKHFEKEHFINSLKTILSEHFGYLMQKGFQIHINGDPLEPKTLPLLTSEDAILNAIQPYDYEANISGVLVKVTVGFYRVLAKETEIEKEIFGPSAKESAGISVVCNDRVILLSDRTMKTGWGDGGVPRYHAQFRSIAGLITFSSNDADLLPISTTKNNLDPGSEVFLKARQACMEGLKIFTNFTNKWKGMEEETNQFFHTASKSDARGDVKLAQTSGTVVRGVKDGRKFSPQLPVPENKNPRRRISFVRAQDEIDTVSRELFGESGQEASLVGGECFDRILKGAKE